MSRLLGRDVLLAFPNYRQYGHLALEMIFGFAEAREVNAPVCFAVPAAERRAMLQLDAEGLEVVRPGAIGRLLLETPVRVEDRIIKLAQAKQRFFYNLRGEIRRSVDRYIGDRPLPPKVRARAKELKSHFREPFSFEVARQRRPERQYYYSRRRLRHPIPVALHAAALADATRQAESVGITEGMRLVTVHAREAGYKFGREMQDTKPQTGRDDSTRNVRIESYFQAIDYLVERGYTVVRMGDPTMVPVNRPGVVDLATSPKRTDLLELHCLMRSAFLLGSDSGPAVVSYLTNTPLVCTNCTDPIAAFPIRANGIYLVKGVTERRTGRRLTIEEMLGETYTTTTRNSALYQYHDNSPEEVLEAVKEMLALIDGNAPLTPKQQRYHQLVLDAEAYLRPRHNYVRKWGADDGFMGDGRIGAHFIDQHLG